MKSDVPPGRWTRKTLVGSLVVGLILLAGLAWIALPVSSWLGSLEASAAMAANPAPIDGKRAFGYLEKICELGPRIAGTEANTRQREMAAAHFKAMGATLHEQHFSTQHPMTGERVDMVNLVASWHPDRKDRVVIGVHYDTRPHPDEEKEPRPFAASVPGCQRRRLRRRPAHGDGPSHEGSEHPMGRRFRAL